MKLVLKNTYPLDKCYALTSVYYQGRNHLIVAAEKQNKCLMFDLDGNLEDTIWEEPGGTMSLVPIPEKDGWFLATQKMYSPNDSKQARIVLVRPGIHNGWMVTTIAEVPFAHRFDILYRGSARFLVVCTIKSDHEYTNDWSHPGQVLACALPDDWQWIEEGKNLTFVPVAESLFHNHGYWKGSDDIGEYCVVSADNGVYKIIPPLLAFGKWKVEVLLSEPTSDIAFLDFDGDGYDEMITLSPFHGDTIRIFSLQEGKYRMCFEYPHKVAFVHALWAGYLDGKPYAIIGYRQGERDILGFSYSNAYQVETLASDVGSTNVLQYGHNGKHLLLSANRETNTIAFYEIEVQNESI